MREKSDDGSRLRAPAVDLDRVLGTDADLVPEAASLLVVRAWRDTKNNRFVARITTITDLIYGSEDVTLVSSTDDVEGVVRRWLEDVSRGGVKPSEADGVTEGPT